MTSSPIRSSLVCGLALATALAAGCGDEPTEDVDSGVQPDGGGSPDTGPEPTPDAGTDSGPTDDGNESFEDAVMVDLAATEPLTGDLSPEGDLDYYKFTATAGTWYVIGTETAAPTATGPGVIDTVVTVFDDAEVQVAEVDDSYPRASTDSLLYWRAPEAGTYFVQVQDYNTWDPTAEPIERTDFDYALFVGAVGGPNALLESEPNDTAATGDAIANGTAGIFATPSGAADQDWYTFTITTGFLGLYGQPNTADGNGSTTLPTRFEITNEAGDEVIARIAPSATSREISPALPAGNYRLRVDGPATPGANDSYAFVVQRATMDNPAEAEEATNGVIATPEELTATEGSYFVLATLGDADVDYYAFDADDGDLVTVVCGSRAIGSGVQGLRLDVQDDAGGTITGGTATETAAANAVIEELAIDAAGTYVLRLSKTGQDPEVSGNWVRCGIHVTAAP